MGKDIKDLFLSKDDDGSNDYKSGWNDAVCYIMDTHKIEARNGEPIQISFDIGLDEDKIAEILIGVKNGKKN